MSSASPLARLVLWPLVMVLVLFALASSALAEFRPAERFRSSGDEIEGWFWLRDPHLEQVAEYSFAEVPATGDIVLKMEVLATDGPSGGPGIDAEFRLLFGFPGAGNMGGVFHAIDVHLENAARPGDPLGYLTRGTILLPRDKVDDILPPTGRLFIRILREDTSGPHVAFNARSLQMSFPEEEGLLDDEPEGLGEGRGEEASEGLGEGVGEGWPRPGDLPDSTGPGDAGDIMPGNWRGRLDPASGDGEDWVRIHAEAGQIISPGLFLPEGLSANLRIRSEGGSIRRDIFVAEGTEGGLRFAADRTGDWLIGILGRTGAGDYGLRVAVTNQDDAGQGTDAGPEVETALTLENGRIRGELLRGDDEDFYVVALEAGEILTLRATSGGEATFGLSLLSPAGGLRESLTVDGETEGLIHYAADTAGDWVIRLRRAEGEGRYTLRLARALQDDGGLPGDAPESADLAGALPEGSSRGQLLPADDRDVFRLPVARGDVIILAGDTRTEELSFGLVLLSPGGALAETVAVNAEERGVIMHVASVEGDWIASLRRNIGDGHYGLGFRIRPQDDAGSGQDAGPCSEAAVPLALPRTAGLLMPGDDLDCYEITLAANETLNLTLRTDGELRTGPLSLRTLGGSTAVGTGLAHEDGNRVTFTRDEEVTLRVMVRRTSGQGRYQLLAGFGEGRVRPERPGGVVPDLDAIVEELLEGGIDAIEDVVGDAFDIIDEGVSLTEEIVSEDRDLAEDIVSEGLETGEVLVEEGLDLADQGLESAEELVDEGLALGEEILTEELEQAEELFETGVDLGTEIAEEVFGTATDVADTILDALPQVEVPAAAEDAYETFMGLFD